MSVLVVGGAGYIGSHIVLYLQRMGLKPIVVDNLSTGHRESLHEVTIYPISTMDQQELEAVFDQHEIDTVMHFSAFSLVGESMKDPNKYYYNNVEGTRSLLEVMVKKNVKRLVFSSTAAVYGEPIATPIVEDVALLPTNPYGETKLAIEKMLKWYDAAYGLKSVALRYFNAAGADYSGKIGEHHTPETHLIPLVLEVALGKREFISVFGEDYPTPDGTCIRDYIHVMDLAQAHVLAMKYLQDTNQSDVFNLGSETGFSVNEVIEVAREVTKHPIPTKMVERRAGDPAVLVASSKKAQDVLGFSLKHSTMEEIITDAWRWHKHHPNGYDSRS